MDTSTHADASRAAESTSTPLASAVESQSARHFDAFETHFFQQGEDASALGGDGTYDDSFDGRDRRRFLSYRSLVGLTGASSALAIVACIALFRSNAPSPSLLVAKVASAQNTLARPGASPGTPTSQNPAPAAQAAADPSTGVAAPPPGDPTLVAAPATIAETRAEISDPTPPSPAAEPSAPKVATTSGSKDDVPKVGEPRADPPTADPPTADQSKAQEPQVAGGPPPRDSDARERCRQSVRSKRAREISAACTAAFEEDATDADAAIAVARVELDRGRFAQASTWCKKAIAVNPDSADAYVLAGGAEQNQGHEKAAKEAYLRYLRLAPAGRYAAEIRTIVKSL